LLVVSFHPSFAQPNYIVNVYNNLLLDANTGAANQYEPTLPRPFLWTADVAVNHQWNLVLVDCFYLIQSVSSGLCLDGNSNPGLPQYSSEYTSPFMWPCSSTAPNHQWNLVPQPNPSGVLQYQLINVQNGLCLDGNVGAAPQYDPGHAAPFLWPCDVANNHLWLVETSL